LGLVFFYGPACRQFRKNGNGKEQDEYMQYNVFDFHGYAFSIA